VKKKENENSEFRVQRAKARRPTGAISVNMKKSEIFTTKKCNIGDSSPRFAVQSPHMTISWDQDRTSGPHQPFVDDIEQQIRHTASKNGQISEFRSQGLWLRMDQKHVVFDDFVFFP
jgi:hypothetical protein